jgi:small-conductance mechanosensitive channel
MMQSLKRTDLMATSKAMRTFNPGFAGPILLTLLLLLLVGHLMAQSAATESDGQTDARLASQLAALDELIERAVRTRFNAIPGLETVEVESQGGLLTLRGEAERVELIELATTIGEQQDGVLQVDNRLSVSTDVSVRVSPLLETLRERTTKLLHASPLLLAALLILAFSLWFGGWLSRRKFIERRAQQQPFVVQLLRQAVRLVVFGLGLLIALDLLGATALLGALLGTAGVVGIAFGFAFRDVAENYIAGVLLSIRQPFMPKDFVDIDGQKGAVARLTSRATILVTPDGNHLRLPNAMVFKAVIVNYSRNPTRRFDFELGVSTDTDLSRACELALKTLDDMPGVLESPSPQAVIARAGDSTMVLQCFGWVDQRETDFLKLSSEAIRLVKDTFDRNGIEMPDPGYRVALSGDHEAREAIESDPSSQSTKTKSEATPEPARQGDVSPDTSVEQVIEQERATDKQDRLSADAKWE